MIDQEQATIVKNHLLGQLQYLGQLRDRLKAVGFTEEFELYHYAVRAHSAVFELQTQLHYLSCGGVFGHTAMEKVKAPPAGEEHGGAGLIHRAAEKAALRIPRSS